MSKDFFFAVFKFIRSKYMKKRIYYINNVLPIPINVE